MGGVRGAQGGGKPGKAGEEMGGEKKMGGKKEASRKDWRGEGRRAVRKQKVGRGRYGSVAGGKRGVEAPS